MAKFIELEAKVAEYQQKYRNSALPEFQDGDFLDLFPDDPKPVELTCKHTWLDSYPYDRTAGVYSILSNELEVLYIGETDNFSARMAKYFRGSIISGCSFTDEWKVSPRYVHFYIAPEGSKFETPALEAFLILEIPDLVNRRIKYR